jgi:hypothetical protein
VHPLGTDRPVLVHIIVQEARIALALAKQRRLFVGLLIVIFVSPPPLFPPGRHGRGRGGGSLDGDMHRHGWTGVRAGCKGRSGSGLLLFSFLVGGVRGVETRVGVSVPRSAESVQTDV